MAQPIAPALTKREDDTNRCKVTMIAITKLPKRRDWLLSRGAQKPEIEVEQLGNGRLSRHDGESCIELKRMDTED